MPDDPRRIPRVDSDAPNEGEALCPGCGYDVRGLPETARCPECATPVWTARSEQVLAFANPEWLDTVARSTRWLYAALVVTGVSAGVPRLAEDWLPDRAQDGSFFVGMTVAAACVYWGVWRITTPNPADAGREPLWSPRRVARAIMLTGPVDVALTVALWRTAVGPGVLISLNALASPVGVAGVVAAWALTRHFEAIARRAEDEFSARRAIIYRRGFFGSWTVAVLCSLMAAGGASPVACLLLPAACCTLGFGVLILLMPTYVAGRLKEAISQAHSLRDRRVAAPGTFR